MLVAVGVFTWLVWTSKNEPGVGRVAGPRPANATVDSISDERYEALAAFEAPAYMPEPGDPKAFLAAMALYSKKDYRGASAALRPNADATPNFDGGRFYLGISLLLSGERIGGIQELRELAMVPSPYQERAHFYLAKGLLAEHDVPRAREQLEDLIAQHGDLEKQATALLNQIGQS